MQQKPEHIVYICPNYSTPWNSKEESRCLEIYVLELFNHDHELDHLNVP